MSIIIPSHYDLSLSPDFNDFSCLGSVTINAEVIEPVTEITLNAIDILFHKTIIRDAVGETEVEVILDPEKQEAQLLIPRRVEGIISIVIDFSSKVSTEYHGLYRCNYEYHGKKKFMITSQFEEEDARRAFPCFDTPALKATFDVELVIPESMTPVFCTDIKKEKAAEVGKKRIQFHQTPVMSTYVLYFGIGELQMISRTNGNLTTRYFSLFDNLDQGAWTLNAMSDAVRYMENKTGVAYPLSKIDYISVPGFPYRAMENYGAIAALDIVVNIDPEKTPPNEIAFNYMIAYHEVTHMWLGNLVTPNNWNDMWLNESFTTFIGIKMVNDLNPNWQTNIFETDYSGRSARILDGGDYVGAIHEPDYNLEFNIADTPIIYKKGSFVLNMFYKLWGDKSFFGGISHIMKSVPYQSLSHDEYTGLFSEGSGHDFRADIMPWILQHGIPELQVKRTKTKVRLTQRRFRYGNTVAGDIWPIPLEIRFRDTANGEKTQSIMMQEESVELSVPNGTMAILCNNGYSGYFRTSFDDDLLEGFLTLCRHRKISADDRAKFIDDLFAFTRRGDYSLDQVFKFLEDYFPDEGSPVVIVELERNLLDAIRISPQYSDRAKQFISNCISHLIEHVEEVHWENQTLGETMYWEDILLYGLAFDCDIALNFSLDIYDKLLATGKCHSALYSAALCSAAYTNRITIEKIISKINDEKTDAAEYFLYLKVLASFRDMSSIKRCLEYGLKELRIDLSKNLIVTMIMTPWMWESIWNLCVNQPDIMERYSSFTKGIIVKFIIPLAALKDLDKTFSFLDKVASESETMAHISRIMRQSIEQDMAMRNRNE